MLDEKDLQAIAGLINQSENRMKGYMDEQILGSENRMKGYMDEQISGSENRMKGYIDERISGSENRMKGYIDEQISGSENRIMTYIESNVEKKIQILAEGHKTILDRLPNVEEQEQIKSRVKVLERVVTNLRVEIDELKKA